MNTPEFNKVADVLEASENYELLNDLYNLTEPELKGISEMINAMRLDTRQKAPDIAFHVVHDVSGFLFKKNDPFWLPRCHRFMEEV